MLSESLIISIDSSIDQAMRAITRSGEGIVFCTRGSEVVGCLSDGDIRRALLLNSDIRRPVSEIVNPDVRVALTTHSPLEVQTQFVDGVKLLPLIDSETRKLIKFLRRPSDFFVPVAEPSLDSDDIDSVSRALASSWISSASPVVTEFEEQFANFVGAPAAVSVTNGTHAIVLALRTLGIGFGDEVLVPSLTFAATANAVMEVGAIPVLVDVDPTTWAIDLVKAESQVTQLTRAIVVVHLYGGAAPMPGVMSLAARNDLVVIEDCAEALGTRLFGRHVGSFGHASTFSFFGNKTMTTGEGGMVVFSDSSMKRSALALRGHGMSPTKRYWHESWGSNYRLSGLQASLGLAQLRKLPGFVMKKRSLAARYESQFADQIDDPSCISFPVEVPNSQHSYWLWTPMFRSQELRDWVGSELQRNGIETRIPFIPLNIQPPYLDEAKSFPASDFIFRHALSFPSSTLLEEQTIDRIVRVAIQACRTHGEVNQ